MTGPIDDAAWASLTEVEDALRLPEYGTSMHYPSCLGGGCTGCLPAVRIPVPVPVCAPAIGVHFAGCGCDPGGIAAGIVRTSPA